MMTARWNQRMDAPFTDRGVMHVDQATAFRPPGAQLHLTTPAREGGGWTSAIGRRIASAFITPM
jgi:hypothetical protein